MKLNVLPISNNVFETVTKVLKSIGNLFFFDCVYFLRGFSENDLANQRLAKTVFLKLGKSIVFSNFSSYSNKWKKNHKDQCQVPLRVIFQLNNTEIDEDFKNFNIFYENHSNEVRSGVWILFLKSFEEKFVSEFFRNIFIPFDVEFIVAWISSEMVHLKEVYQLAPSYPLKQPYFGNWSLKAGFFSPIIFSRYLRRTNLEGLQLKVGYIDENSPFTMMRSTAHKNYLDGYFGEIWHILEGLMNISSTYIEIDLKRDKDEDKNSWLRAIKMLQEKKLDVGLGDFISSTNRVDQLDFSYPLLASNFQIFYKNSPTDRIFHGNLRPFSYEIWLTLLLWSVIISFCICCFVLIRKRFICKKEKVLSTSTAFLMTFGGLCGQGYSNVPGFPSIRMLLLFTYIVAGIMIPSYSASLTHYLSYKPLGVTFKSLNDFFEKGTHKTIVVDGSYEYYILENLSKNSEIVKKIFQQDLKNENLPKSYREALLLICKEKNIGFFTVTSTLIWEMNKAENAILKDYCKLRKMTENAGMLLSGIIYPKNSRFRGLIDHHLKSLQESGVINRIQQKYWPHHPNLIKKSWKSNNMENLSAVFYILIFGVISSSVLMVSERIIKKLFLFPLKKKLWHFFKVLHIQNVLNLLKDS